jgi:hypothetical protein
MRLSKSASEVIERAEMAQNAEGLAGICFENILT